MEFCKKKITIQKNTVGAEKDNNKKNKNQKQTQKKTKLGTSKVKGIVQGLVWYLAQTWDGILNGTPKKMKRTNKEGVKN